MATNRGGVRRVLLKLDNCFEAENYYEAHQLYRTLHFRLYDEIFATELSWLSAYICLKAILSLNICICPTQQALYVCKLILPYHTWDSKHSEMLLYISSYTWCSQ